jgi:hypothetical protein
MQSEHMVRGKRRPTTEERLQMVDRFHRSGLTHEAFCEQEGIPISTLGYWLSRIRRTSKDVAPVVFSEVRLASPIAPQANSWAMEIVARSGVTIRCREPMLVGDLARLLRGRGC